MGYFSRKEFDEWQRVQCICGAVVGRCQRHTSDDKGHSAITYRMAKYALRPVSATAECVFRVFVWYQMAEVLFRPLRIPISAFILEDMMEFVHAHATYRFLILDEEEGKPRLLVRNETPLKEIKYWINIMYRYGSSSRICACHMRQQHSSSYLRLAQLKPPRCCFGFLAQTAQMTI